MTVTPAIVYTNQASDYTCTFVSENVSRIMGFSAWEMLEDKDFWTVRLHPEDAKRVFEEMAPLIEKGGGTIEYRFRHRDGHYIWIQDTFRVIRDAQGRPIGDRRLLGRYLRPQGGGATRSASVWR